MKRFTFLLSLVGLGSVAKSQTGVVDLGKTIKVCYPEDETCTTPIAWQRRAGRALNNQCPVCGTMADVFDRPMRHLFDRYALACPSDPNCFEYYEVNPRDEPFGPMKQIQQCLKCNCAFFQEATR